MSREGCFVIWAERIDNSLKSVINYNEWQKETVWKRLR